MDNLGSLSHQLSYMLHRVDLRSMDGVASALAEIGLTPARATAVVYIAMNQGCDQMALGRALGINRASAMKVVNRLVALGMVERRAARDRRSNALYLTNAGAEAQARVEDITRAADDMNFSVLSQDERMMLRGMLSRLLTAGPAAAEEISISMPLLRLV